MPSVQQGGVSRHGNGWRATYYDDNGNRHRKGGFETKSAGREWVNGKVEEVAALRRGDPATIRRRDLPTFAELVAEFLEQHNAEANTIRTLKARLRYVTEGPALD